LYGVLFAWLLEEFADLSNTFCLLLWWRLSLVL